MAASSGCAMAVLSATDDDDDDDTILTDSAGLSHSILPFSSVAGS